MIKTTAVYMIISTLIISTIIVVCDTENKINFCIKNVHEPKILNKKTLDLLYSCINHTNPIFFYPLRFSGNI
jgi:hypothetical protein